MPRKLPRIYDLPYTDLVAELPPGAAPLPLPDGAGSAFVERDVEEPEEAVAGRIALLAGGVGGSAEAVATLVVEHADWSVACPLSRGQLHRLTNALDGRGTRPGIRPLSVDGATVHLGGSPERLTVEVGERRVVIPAGPKRALAKALRAAEGQLATG